MAAGLKLRLSAVIGTCFYLALAIWGWDGFGPFFAHPARIAVTVIFFALTFAAMLTRGNLSTGTREDRGNRWVLWAFGVLSILAAYLSAWCDRRDVWVLDGDAMRWIGVALMVPGGVIRLWPVYVLGNRFSGLVAIQPGHSLVTTGIYRVVRNPSYVGLLLSSFAWALAFRSVIGVILAALMIPPLIARIHAEERLLASQFGAEYEAYRARTWRLIPGLY
ncbi:MAG TPA: isoprenylcysteine carboxylmethyltransferase family protein [Rhizomicrobium sp.]|nr:isoprenylcysteine carboxylmethyltransferase family protein [Rhizomicrobium sp.]